MRHGKSPRTRRRTSPEARPPDHFLALPMLSGCVGHTNFSLVPGIGKRLFVTKQLMQAGRFRRPKR
jgi:hypothetical protein